MSELLKALLTLSTPLWLAAPKKKAAKKAAPKKKAAKKVAPRKKKPTAVPAPAPMPEPEPAPMAPSPPGG